MFEECAFIAVTTTDLVQAKRFWVTLLECPIVREGDNYLMVNAGGVRLCFDLPDRGTHKNAGSDPVNGLKVKDLDTEQAVLTSRGIRVVEGPCEAQSGK